MQAGDASYSIYLLHVLVFMGMVYFAARLGLPAWLFEPWRFATLLLCCIISYRTWRKIEVPMIEFGNRLADNSLLKPATKRVA